MNVIIKTDNRPALMRALSAMKRAVAKVGFPEEKGSESVTVTTRSGESETRDTLTIAEYAAYNEFGTSRGIPPRPFMRESAEAFKHNSADLSARITQAIEEGRMTVTQGLNVMAERMKEEIRDTIQNGSFEPLAPSTVSAKKGSDKTLIDSGAMIQSVSHVVDVR